MQVPLPIDEKERLQALLSYEILDTEPEQDFDDITLLACHICATPMAMVSLVDARREWFKSKAGFAAGEGPRETAFCAHGILHSEMLVVPDARADERFACNPLVTGQARIRFYAGAPLITPGGHALGMLCVKDQRPRDLSEAQKTALQALSRQVVALLESRRGAIRLRETVAQLQRAQSELERHTAILEAQVHSTINGILIVDQNRKTILQNQRFVDLMKMPARIADEECDESRLRWARSVIKNPVSFLEKVEHLYAHPQETIHDEIVLKDGTILERDSSPALGKDGTYHGRIWVFRDITARKRLQAQVLQSQKMETVGKLAGGIAHEFNSILTAIIGQTEILAEDLSAGSPAAKLATEIKKAAGRAAGLTRQLLAYGRKQVLQPETLDLNGVVANLEEMIGQLAGPKVATNVMLGRGVEAVHADAAQIEQVIMNIVMNARDAMPHGGRLTVETANVVFSPENAGREPELKAGDYVMLAITDTGTGMTEEVKARAFEPFYTTKGVGQGTGLGLSMCYGIVKQSGGHISIQSEPGRGATLKIWLPQVRPPETAPPTPPEAPAALPRGTETILLVEDHPALREMAATLLKRLGYTVWPAASRNEAFRLMEQSPGGRVDLLFTDAAAPQWTGPELAERVRSLHPSAKVLFTSAYAESAAANPDASIPGAGRLHKPYTPSALAQKVRQVLES